MPPQKWLARLIAAADALGLEVQELEPLADSISDSAARILTG